MASFVFGQSNTRNVRTAGAPSPEFDRSLAWAALLLVSLGLVMVYSSSIATAEAGRYTGNNSAYFLLRHSLFLALALSAATAVFLVPVRLWQKAAPWFFAACIVLLVLVLVPGIGREVNGARRWLNLGVANMQPSELMKLAVVLYAADYTVRKHAVLKNFRRGLLPMLAVMLVVAWLLLREPDFGAFVVVAVSTFGVLFLGGMSGRHFSALLGMLGAGFVVLVLSSPYRMQRILGFMDPWSDAYGKGYQLSHALIAFGRGEWLGVGLGASVEKLHYLPEAHTDFLLAVIAEELGAAGSGGGDRAVRLGGAARVLHRPPSRAARAPLSRARGAGDRHLDRLPGAHQYGRQHGPAADQGPDAAADELRRFRPDRELRGDSSIDPNRLGKPPARKRSERMSAFLRSERMSAFLNSA